MAIKPGRSIMEENEVVVVQEVIDQSIVDGLNKLDELEPGSEDYARQVNAVANLIKVRNEDNRNNNDYCLKEEQISKEIAIKEQELEIDREDKKVQKRHFWVTTLVSVGTFVGGLLAYGIWNRRGYRFEETGSITSKTFTRSLNDSKILKGVNR